MVTDDHLTVPCGDVVTARHGATDRLAAGRVDAPAISSCGLRTVLAYWPLSGARDEGFNDHSCDY